MTDFSHITMHFIYIHNNHEGIHNERPFNILCQAEDVESSREIQKNIAV